MNTTDLIERVAVEHGVGKGHVKRDPDRCSPTSFPPLRTARMWRSAPLGRIGESESGGRKGRGSSHGSPLAAQDRLAFTPLSSPPILRADINGEGRQWQRELSGNGPRHVC